MLIKLKQVRIGCYLELKIIKSNQLKFKINEYKEIILDLASKQSQAKVNIQHVQWKQKRTLICGIITLRDLAKTA